MRKGTVLIASLVVAVAAACSSGGGASAGRTPDDRIEVVTTTTQLTDFARNVGGDHVDVYGLLRANVDPHDFEASPADLQHVGVADMVVRNGLGLEDWFEDTIASADPRGVVVDASGSVPVRRGDSGESDPHIWQSPRNAQVMVGHIADALVEADPAHTADYRRNEAAYVGDLGDLDAEVARELSVLTNRKVVTDHDAFGYYLDRYDLEFVGSIIPSFDSQAELSTSDVRDIVNRIRAAGVNAVFSERSLPPKVARTIAREAGVDVVAGEDSLFGDSLGASGSGGDTYVGAIRHNTRELVDHLR